MQETQNSQNNAEKEVHGGRTHTSWVQNLLQRNSTWDNVVWAQWKTNGSMERNEYRNKPLHLWATEFWQFNEIEFHLLSS